MTPMTLAECLGDISEELLADLIYLPGRRRIKRVAFAAVAAVLVLGLSLGLYFGGIVPHFRTPSQCGYEPPENPVYEIVRLEATAQASPLYVHSVTPGDEVIAAVREKFRVDFGPAIFVFETDAREYGVARRYWFPLIRDGEIRLILDARVSPEGISLSSTHHFNDFLNTVSGLTGPESPGYIVLENDTFFCVVDGKAYCTEIIWDDLDYVGEIAFPGDTVSAVRVN